MATVPTLTRDQILAFRQTTGGLHERLPRGRRSLRSAAWAGLQDSMPRAAVLSAHARVDEVPANVWEDPSLVQVWGPRFSAYVVPASDVAVFTLGRLPGDARGRERAYRLAAELEALLGGGSMPFGEAGRALGVDPNQLRYAAATGSVRIRWDGARQPTIRSVPAPEVEPGDAQMELARRYLRVFGPATEEGFAGWAGIRRNDAVAAFSRLGRTLTEVLTPLGSAWLLDRDVEAMQAPRTRDGVVRLLPSGDAYYLLKGEHLAFAKRSLVVGLAFGFIGAAGQVPLCLLYTSDAADERG